MRRSGYPAADLRSDKHTVICIFGADNTGDWHIHPFESPDLHIPIPKAMSFAEFVAEIEKHFA